MPHHVPLAGHLDEHALALEHLQGAGGHSVRHVVMLGDGLNRGNRPVMAPCAISSRIIFATCSYGGTAESGSITWASIE
jgi:hypothetical protein